MEIVIYTKPNCSHCEELKVELTNMDISFKYIDMMALDGEAQKALRADAVKHKQRMMPIVYIDGEFVKTEEVIKRVI